MGIRIDPAAVERLLAANGGRCVGVDAGKLAAAMTGAKGGASRGPWTLTLKHWHPARLNQLLGNRWKAGRLKAADRGVLLAARLNSGTPVAAGPRRVTLTIRLQPRQRAADPDAYWKSTLDACVQCGLLLEDNRQGVELTPVRFERGTADDWGSVLVLEDL